MNKLKKSKILLLLIIFSISSATFFIINHFSFQNHYETVLAELTLTEEDVIDVSELRNELVEIKEARVANFIRKSWLGPFSDAFDRVTEIRDKKEVLYEDLINELHMNALAQLKILDEYEKSRSLRRSETRESDLQKAETPNDYLALLDQWESEQQQWESSIEELSSISNGLIDQQPKDIMILESRYTALIEKLTNKEELENVGTIETSLNNFYTKHPKEQVSLHRGVKEHLTEAIDKVTTIVLNEKLTEVLQNRVNLVSVALYDHITGFEYSYYGNLVYRTASTVKAKLMAAILYDSALNSRDLTETEKRLIPPMIQESDNVATTTLWRTFGGRAKTIRLVEDFRLTNTIPNDVWGLTETTVEDQVKLMKYLAYPNSYLPDEQRKYALEMMQSVAPDQKWGITGGLPSDAKVALKNGWVGLQTGGWRVNSFGHVDGNGKDYIISVMTISSPTKDYAINTIEEISKIIWESF